MKTLALLKPDLCASSTTVSGVLSVIRQRGFVIVQLRRCKWTVAEAERFYSQHQDRFFFNRLCGYMSSGEFMALVLQKDNSIQDWRALIGPTAPIKYYQMWSLCFKTYV